MLETGDTYDVELSKELLPKNFNVRGKGKGTGKRSAARGKITKIQTAKMKLPLKVLAIP